MRLDERRADATVAELLTTARLIEDQLHRRASIATRARDGWSGGHRRTFDADYGRLVGEGERLAATLRAAAAALQACAADARAEQARRIEERERWEREAAAENEVLARTG